MKKYIFTFLLLLVSGWAIAQNKVITFPSPTLSTNASTTIASTNTFQSVFAASQQTVRTLNTLVGRQGCIIQNNSASNNMFIFPGPIANASTVTSLTLAKGLTFNCQIGGIVLQDQISITGTSGDAFFAVQE
jgi:hypothetical protein